MNLFDLKNIDPNNPDDLVKELLGPDSTDVRPAKKKNQPPLPGKKSKQVLRWRKRNKIARAARKKQR